MNRHSTPDANKPRAGFGRGAGRVGAAGYVGALTTFVRSIVLARILSPSGLGLFSGVLMASMLAQNADLGVVAEMGREMPTLKTSDSERGHAVAAAGLGIKVVVSLILGPIVGVVVLGVWLKGFDFGVPGVLLVASLVLSIGPWQWLQSWLTAEQRFGRLSRLNVMYAVGTLLVCAGGAILFGVVGAVGGYALVTAALSIWGLWTARAHLDFRKATSVMPQLVRFGMPMMILAILAYLLVNVDQLVVGRVFGARALGLYAIALMIGQFIALVPVSLGTVVGPRLLAAYGEVEDVNDVHDYVWLPVELLSIALVIPLSLAIILVHPGIEVFLPAYTQAVLPARVYAFAVYFLLLNSGVSSTLFALDKHRSVIPMIASCVVFNVVVDAILVSLLHELWVVALGSLLTYVLYYAIHLGFVRSHFRAGVSAVVGFLLTTAAPALVMAVCFGLTIGGKTEGMLAAVLVVLIYSFAASRRMVSLFKTMMGAADVQ